MSLFSGLTENPPCLVYEDDDLLVMNKPAGVNTHAPSPYHGEGLYDWLRHREPRWAGLAIVHRLDKETSGLMVFGKSVAANKSLTAQFTDRGVKKRYRLLVTGKPTAESFTVSAGIRRAGDHYVAVPKPLAGERAETRFRVIGSTPLGTELEAEPVTGRTHQIRVHAAHVGLPILGDELYGGSPFSRVCLHAAQLSFQHPVSEKPLNFTAPTDFTANARASLRQSFTVPTETNACRWIHGAADGWPGWYVDRLGDWWLSQAEGEITFAQRDQLKRWLAEHGGKGAYHKMLRRRVQSAATADVSPQPCLGETCVAPFSIRENGLQYELSFQDGYSVGLFLDQRDNRRRLLAGHVAAGFPLRRDTDGPFHLLNTFAYTCGFSVAAARGGATVTSLDLSRKYLDWGKRHFTLNGLDPARHDFIFGDVFDWMRRLAKKGRRFHAVLLDPPTFSHSKVRGTFRAESDYDELVELAAALLEPNGLLFASTNAASLPPERFLALVQDGLKRAGRTSIQQHYVPQSPDFPIDRAEPAYLKTVWLRVR